MGHTIIIILQVKKKIHKQVKKLAQGHIARSDLTQSVFSSQSFNFHTLLPPTEKVIGVMETKYKETRKTDASSV